MTEITEIYNKRIKFLSNLRFVAAAFLALVMSFGLSQGVAAQIWDLEIVVVDGNTTIFRCNSTAEFEAQTNDCSDNNAAWDCNGEVIVVEKDELGGCATRLATVAESLTLITEQELLVDIILTDLGFQELPGGGPQTPLQGQLDPDTFQSTESIQTQAIDSTPSVTTGPAASP